MRRRGPLPDHAVRELDAIDVSQPLPDRLAEAAEALQAHMDRLGAIMGSLGHHGGRHPGTVRGAYREESTSRVRAALADLLEPEKDSLRHRRSRSRPCSSGCSSPSRARTANPTSPHGSWWRSSSAGRSPGARRERAGEAVGDHGGGRGGRAGHMGGRRSRAGPPAPHDRRRRPDDRGGPRPSRSPPCSRPSPPGRYSPHWSGSPRGVPAPSGPAWRSPSWPCPSCRWLSDGMDGGTRGTLALMHLAVAAVLIPGLVYGSRAGRPAREGPHS